MIKRVVKFVFFIPIVTTTLPLELIGYSIRWVITGKSFPDMPIAAWFLFEW